MVKEKRTYEAPGYYRQKVVSGKPVCFQRMAKKVNRNEPCPCGSGMKFKFCHKTDAALLQAAFEQRQAELKEKEIQENL